MKLYSVEITAEDRSRGWVRAVDEAIAAIRHALDNVIASHSEVTIRITVTAEEPEERA